MLVLRRRTLRLVLLAENTRPQTPLVLLNLKDVPGQRRARRLESLRLMPSKLLVEGARRHILVLEDATLSARDKRNLRALITEAQLERFLPTLLSKEAI